MRRLWHVTVHPALRQVPQREGAVVQDCRLRLLQGEEGVSKKKLQKIMKKISRTVESWELYAAAENLIKSNSIICTIQEFHTDVKSFNPQ